MRAHHPEKIAAIFSLFSKMAVSTEPFFNENNVLTSGSLERSRRGTRICKFSEVITYIRLI